MRLRSRDSSTALGRGVRLCAVGALVTGTGCALVIGLRDDYVAEEADAATTDAAADATRDAAPSVFDFLGEPTGSCKSCLADKCATQASACAADPPCAEAAACMAGCDPTTDGPACFDLCTISEATKPRGDYVNCAATQCLDACRVGVEFGCIGAYTWPPATPDPDGLGRVTFRILRHLDNLPRPGVGVTPCPFNATNYVCDDAGTRVTDSAGNARLEIRFVSGIGTTTPEVWSGYYQVSDPAGDAGDPLLPTLFRETRPVFKTRGGALIAPLASAQEIGAAYLVAGVPRKPGTGTVLGALQDCRGLSATQRARGLSASIPDSGVSAVYTRSNDFPEEGATGSVGGGFFILNVPAGRGQVIEVALPDGGPYARARLDVEDGGVTTVAIWPQPTNVDRQ